MSDEQRANIIDTIQRLGFPTVVAGVLLYIGNSQMEIAGKRFDEQQTFITTTLTSQIEKSNIVISASNSVLVAINETLKRLADEQVQTRAVLREVQDMHGPGT